MNRYEITYVDQEETEFVECDFFNHPQSSPGFFTFMVKDEREYPMPILVVSAEIVLRVQQRENHG